jgi:hypothetical protein
LGGIVAPDASAQKIVCWKDKSGKTLGCGDKVPPEFQDNASQELDKQGVTRKSNESAEQKAARQAKDQENERIRVEQEKKAAEQRRQDSALVNTYSNEKEIDLRRDRELAQVDAQVTQLKVMQKNASDRQKEVKGRMDTLAKSGKQPTDVQKDEMARADADARKANENLANKEKEKDDIRTRYAAARARYIELRGGAPAPAPAPAPAAAAKK